MNTEVSPWKELDDIGLNYFNSRSEEDFNKLHKHFKGIIASYLSKNYPHFLSKLKEIQSSVFSSIYENIHEFNPEYKFSQWAFTIVRNECYGRIRIRYSQAQRMHNSIYPIDEIVFTKMTENNIEEIYEEEYRLAVLENVKKAISELKEPYASILHARFIKETKIKDLAIEYNVSPNTIKTWTRDGIKYLQRALGITVPRKPEDKGKWGKPLCNRSRNKRIREKLKEDHKNKLKDDTSGKD